MSAPGAAQPLGSRARVEEAWSLLREATLRSSPSLVPWSLAFRVEAGGALDFSMFPFQRELHEAFGDPDLATVDVMKSAQCGVSATAVSLALYAAAQWRANVMYVLPTEELAHGFSDTRVKTAIAGSPYLSTLLRDSNTKGLKQIGPATMYFVGSGSVTNALSTPVDLLILDEYDHLDQRNIPIFERRLNSPKSMRLRRRFSNPTYPEFGIHGLYLESDQREWLVRCRRCRYEAPIFYDPLDGSHYVEEELRARVCGQCRRVIGPEVVASGRWVAARPDREARGYHISRLIVPDDDIVDLIRKHPRRNP